MFGPFNRTTLTAITIELVTMSKPVTGSMIGQ